MQIFRLLLILLFFVFGYNSRIGGQPEIPAEPEEQIQESSPDLYQEEARIEPTDLHDRQMLACLDEASGSQINIYVSTDMDKDGICEMIGVTDHAPFSVWYCSSDLENCYMVSDGHTNGYDYCAIELIDLNGETHVAVNTCNIYGTGKAFSIFALHDGEIEVLVDNNYGYVYMNEENDIILDVEAYDGIYDGTLGYWTWTTHTWKDTYLYYENGRYKEYGAAPLSEEDFLTYDNARELLAEIEEENLNRDVIEIHYNYFIRENGIIHIQCEVKYSDMLIYGYYTLRENGNYLDGTLFMNPGIMYPSFSWLDDVTFP